MNNRIAILTMVLLGGAVGALGGENKNLGRIVECDSLKLEAAGGLPGAETHKYRFGGACKLLQKGVVDGKPKTTWLATFPVVVLASWNGKQNRLTENLELPSPLQVDGKSYSGKSQSQFICLSDPIVAKSASCKGAGHTNSIGLDAFTNAYLLDRAYAHGATTLAAATELSKKNAPDPGPEPKQATVPPPMKKPPPPGLKSAQDQGIAPHVTIRSPKAGQLVSGVRLHFDVAGAESLIEKFGLDGVDLEWQWAPVSERLPGHTGNWQNKEMLKHLKWTAREGHIFVATADLPMTRFSDSTRWRVRASALPAVHPTEWVTFSVVPLAQ